MSVELKLRRGSTLEHSTFVGAEGEITVDTDKDILVIHDGITPGGKPQDIGEAKGLAEKRAIAFFGSGELTAGPNKAMVISPYNLQIQSLKMSVGTAPATTDLIVDILKNGVTIYTTTANRPTVLVGTTSSVVTLPDVVEISEDDILSIEVVQAGGSDLALTILAKEVM